MNIKTNVALKNLKGEEIKDDKGEVFTLGQALANIVVEDKIGGKMKLYILGTKLFQEKEIEVDSADLNLIKEALKKSETYGALILGQCEMLLENVKKEDTKTK